MAYCRYSSKQPKCDLYCYGSGTGYETHVGQSDMMQYPLGLPHDGASFTDPDLQSFKARLIALRDMGYRIPDEAFERIDAELAEP